MFSGSNVLITGGNFFETNIQGANRELDLLQQATSPNGFHDSGHNADPPRCLPNTRRAIQHKILEWTKAEYQPGAGPFVIWVKGSAGVGKTAIAGSIAESCATKGNLMASYFFSRFDPGRNEAGHLVATITYQMITNIPECLTDVLLAIKKDPLIFQRALEIQFRSLFVDPLRGLVESGCAKYSGVPHVIVMDGLDECKDPKFQVRILEMFADLLPQCLLPICLLVASRPERHLAAAFQVAPVSNVTTELDLDKQFPSYDDVHTYFITKLDEIKTTHQVKEHIPSDWPTTSDIQTLTHKSSGQFIYASTVIKYVASICHHPVERLVNILKLGSIGSMVDNPLAEVDALYLGILSGLHHPKSEVLRILIPVVYNKGTPVDEFELEAFLGYRQGGIQLLLTDLASIVSRVEDPDGFIRLSIFHASFADFLHDSARSKDMCISNQHSEHTAIVRRSFEILRARNQKLFRKALRIVIGTGMGTRAGICDG